MPRPTTGSSTTVLVSQDGEPPPPAAPNGEPGLEAFLTPLLLLLLAAGFGALRSLLASPVRGHVLAGLEDETVARVDRALERRPHLAATAGLLRLLTLVGAALLLVRAATALTPTGRVVVWVAAVVFAGLALEGAPALVARRRLRRPVLALLPLVVLFDPLLRPLTWLLERMLEGARGENGDEEEAALSARLLDVAAEHEPDAELGETEQRMISRVLDLPEEDAASAMTPRTELTAVPADSSLADALRVAVEAGHSRIPVYGKDLDDVLGVFHVKDVIGRTVEGADLEAERVGDHVREAFFVPETMGLLPLLDEMRQRRNHLAVVVDEYGGTAGVVTIEDLLEQVVGEIQDEHDQKEELARMEFVGEDAMVADGRVAIGDLNESFGCDLPEDEEYDTVAGLLFDRFGHIPRVGERLEVDGVAIEVVAADDRRIHRVRLERLQPSGEGDEAA